MKKIFFTFFILGSIHIFSQPIQYGIFNEGTDLVIKVKPSVNYTTANQLTDAVFTIRWDNSYSIDLGSVNTNYTIIKSGSVNTESSYEYQKFAFSGSPVSLDENWSEGNEYEILRVAVIQNGSGMGTFELSPKGFPSDNSGDPYLEIDLVDRTNSTAPYYQQSTDNVPLPVELTSFSAAVSDNNVKLQWQTATELNNHGFSIERKNISSSAENKNVWDSISFIEGHGNSNSQKHYMFIDKAPRAGKYIYRLKQIDNDGQFAYSDEVEIEISVNDYFLSQNYPNPFNPSTSIQYSLPEKSSVKISIFSLTGEVIESTGYITKDPGSYDYKWSAANYSSGVYFFSIEASSLDNKRNFSSTKKMILNK